MKPRLGTMLRSCRQRARDSFERVRITQGAYTRCTMLVCGERLDIARSQVHPLLDWVPDQRVGWLLRENAHRPALWRKTQPQVAFLQSYWDTPFVEMETLIALIREESPRTKICYLDWFAPANVPEPRLIDLVDLYVKKNILRDRSQYLNGMCETNLVEYEAQWDAEFLNPRQGVLTEQQLSKLTVGWSFATDRRLVEALQSDAMANTDRPIDLHCRIFSKNERTWYHHMRNRCVESVNELATGAAEGEQIVCSAARLDWDAYMRELASSKACLSPFGYGEVCWRDFEAIAAGAVLVKPNMDHLEVFPDIYIPGETYIDIDWSFSDLKAKYESTRDSGLQKKLADNAWQRWKSFVATDWNNHWNDTLQKLLET